MKCLVGAQVEVIKKAYMQGEIEVEHNDDDENGEEEHTASPRNVGHNIYILAHQVTHTNMHSHTLWLRSLCQMSGLYHHLPVPRVLQYRFSAYSRNYLGQHQRIGYVTPLGTVQLFHRLSEWYCLASGVREWKKQRTNTTLDTLIHCFPNNREMCFCRLRLKRSGHNCSNK